MVYITCKNSCLISPLKYIIGSWSRLRANQNKIFELMNIYCNGNYNRFGRELKVDPSHLHRFINTGVGGGKKLVGAIIKFCKEKELDFEDYIDI